MPLREGIGGGPLTGARSMSELMDLPFDEFTRHARGEPRPVANDVHDTPPPNRHRRFEPPTSVLASPSPRGIPFDLDDHDPSASYEALLELDRGVLGRGLSPLEKSRFIRRVHNAAILKGATCPISRERFAPGEPAVRLPCKCAEVVFKERAISRWLDERRTCPVCRTELGG